MFFDKVASFVGSVGGMEKLIDSAKIDRHRINFAVVSNVDFVDVVSKSSKLINIIPDLLIGSMEEMGAVFMAFDAGLGVKLGVAIAADMSALVDEENFFAQ